MVNSVAYSPDGRRLVTASDDGTIKLWDTATGQEVFTLRGHIARVLCVAFSPDGRRIVSGSSDRTVKVWDLDPSRAEVLSRREALVQASSAVDSGEPLLRAGRWDEAAAALTSALSSYPDSPPLRLARGEALAGLGQFRRAETDFAEVIRLAPHDRRGRYYHVLSLLERGIRPACDRRAPTCWVTSAPRPMPSSPTTSPGTACWARTRLQTSRRLFAWPSWR